MKVYESSHPTKRDFTKVPQIKIKNSQLVHSGFKVGKEFAVVYQPGKITLVLVDKEGSNHQFYKAMSFKLTNHINQSIKNGMHRQKVGIQSVHFRYNDSGILEKCRNEKSPKTYCFKAFLSGADETRTRDLLRDRQAF